MFEFVGIVSLLEILSKINVSHSMCALEFLAAGVKCTSSRKFVTPPLRDTDLEIIEERVLGAA